LEDIRAFQQKRAFEATGLLTTEQWEDPNLEIWLNCRKFDKVCELFVYLACHNQKSKVLALLERLYLRGMRLEEIYDQIIFPAQQLVVDRQEMEEVSASQALLVHSNIEECLYHLIPKLVRRRRNGKTALCAAPTHASRIPVLTIAKVLEVEGWEALILGEGVGFSLISELVEMEPVNLVCLFISHKQLEEPGDCAGLNHVASSYRIPVVLIGKRADAGLPPDLSYQECFGDFRSFRDYVASLGS
jgi:hypothetical protein